MMGSTFSACPGKPVNWAREYEVRPRARAKPRLRLESAEVSPADAILTGGVRSAVYRIRITLHTGPSWTAWQPTISWAWRDARRKLRALDML